MMAIHQWSLTQFTVLSIQLFSRSSFLFIGLNSSVKLPDALNSIFFIAIMYNPGKRLAIYVELHVQVVRTILFQTLILTTNRSIILMFLSKLVSAGMI